MVKNHTSPKNGKNINCNVATIRCPWLVDEFLHFIFTCFFNIFIAEYGWGIPSFGAPADFRRGSDAGGHFLASNHHSLTAMHAPACGPVSAAKFGPSGREYEAPCHALEIPGPHQVAVGCYGRLELRALGFAPDGLACADVGHGCRTFGCYRHVFGRRRTNARFRGSQPVGSTAHTLIDSRPRAFSPPSWFAPSHTLRTTGRTVREETSAALSHELNPNAATRRAAQGAFSEGYGLAGGSLFHGQAGDLSSCPLSVLALSLGAPSAAWFGGRNAGPRICFLGIYGRNLSQSTAEAGGGAPLSGAVSMLPFPLRHFG